MRVHEKGSILGASANASAGGARPFFGIAKGREQFCLQIEDSGPLALSAEGQYTAIAFLRYVPTEFTCIRINVHITKTLEKNKPFE